MKYSVILVIALTIIGCNRITDKQIDKGSKDAYSSSSLSVLIHRKHCPKQIESLVKACNQWGALNKEIEEMYYIVQTKPSWYRGSEGYKNFYKDCETIKALHLSLYQTSPGIPCSQVSSNHYIYLEDAKELFLACCQRTIDRELPESYETCIEHKNEMAHCRKDANGHLNRIKVLLDDWIEAREQYAKDLSDLPYDSADYVDRSQTERKTSEFLIGLSEIISLP